MRIFLAASIVALMFAAPAYAGKCTGSANCNACKNCSSCKHCKAGGTCGVCSKSEAPATQPSK